MFNCKCNCSYIALIVGIIAGIGIGVLSGFGLLTTAPILAFTAGVGILGLFLLPIYSILFGRYQACGCFCSYRIALIVSSLGTALASLVTYILFRSAVNVIATAVFFGLTALFAVMLAVMLICVTSSVACRDE